MKYAYIDRPSRYKQAATTTSILMGGACAFWCYKRQSGSRPPRRVGHNNPAHAAQQCSVMNTVSPCILEPGMFKGYLQLADTILWDQHYPIRGIHYFLDFQLTCSYQILQARKSKCCMNKGKNTCKSSCARTHEIHTAH